MDEIRPSPDPPVHGPEPAEEASSIGKRRRRRHRHRRRKQTDKILSSESGEMMLTAGDPDAETQAARLAREERPHLQAILDDDGEIRCYHPNTRQRVGAKYLLREVFD